MPEPPSMLQSILLGWISSLIETAYSNEQAQGLPKVLFFLTPLPILRPILGTTLWKSKSWDSFFIWESFTCMVQITVNGSRSFKGVGFILTGLLRKKSKPKRQYTIRSSLLSSFLHGIYMNILIKMAMGNKCVNW